MQPTDGAHIFQLITSNTSIQMLDLRNNQLAVREDEIEKK